MWVYNGAMVLRSTPHAVSDTLSHLVWSPKDRRDVWQGEVQQRVQARFADIAEQYDITSEEMEGSPDQVHIFWSFPPRSSIAHVVTRFKSGVPGPFFARSPASSDACGVGHAGKMAILPVPWGTRSRRR